MEEVHVIGGVEVVVGPGDVATTAVDGGVVEAMVYHRSLRKQ